MKAVQRAKHEQLLASSIEREMRQCSRSDFMEGSIRICFVSFYFWPSIGGAEVRAEKIARQLQALGYDVTVVTFRHDRQWERKEMLDGLPVVRVGGIYRRDGRLNTGRLGYLPANIAMFLTLWRLRHS